MLKLLRTLILRPLRRDLLRTALTILSVALGVAVVVAIDLAGDAAAGSFRSSIQALTGKTDLEIIATGGIDEQYMAILTALPYDLHFAPLMEAQLTLPGIGGGEVFAELQRIRPGVKVVLTTAYSQEMARAAVGGDQAWAFIRKPYRGKDLAALLGDALMEQGSTES